MGGLAAKSSKREEGLKVEFENEYVTALLNPVASDESVIISDELANQTADSATCKSSATP